MEEGAKFYRDEIFNHYSSGKFHLYDLAAWEGLRKFKSKITAENKITPEINRLALKKYSAIASAAFLDDLAEEKNPKVISYYNNVILKNPALMVHSATRRKNNVLIKEKLPGESVKEIHDLDTASAYSALQYLEGIYLIKKIIQDRHGKDTNIVFLLPNDEYKYYTTPELEKDVNTILGFTMSHIPEVRVLFKSFKFGDDIHLRPYIMKGAKVTTETIKNYLP